MALTNEKINPVNPGASELRGFLNLGGCRNSGLGGILNGGGFSFGSLHPLELS